MKTNGATEPSLPKSLLLSVLFHGLLVAGILFLAKPKPLPEVVSMEASLVGSGDLAGIQGQIAKAYAKNQAQTQAQSQSQTHSPTKPSQANDYSQDIARREAEYQAQMKAYADALDQDIASEMHAYQQALDEADRKREREVAELERRERSNDDIAQENAKELQKAKEQLAKERTQQSKQESSAPPASNDRPTQTTQQGQGQSQTGTYAGSSGGSSNAGLSGTNKASSIDAIKERIYRNWSLEAGLKGKSLTATIRVDSTGQVTDIRFGAGDNSLASSLESAIRTSAPFPEAVGVMSQFTIRFFAD